MFFLLEKLLKRRVFLTMDRVESTDDTRGQKATDIVQMVTRYVTFVNINYYFMPQKLLCLDQEYFV